VQCHSLALVAGVAPMVGETAIHGSVGCRHFGSNIT